MVRHCNLACILRWVGGLAGDAGSVVEELFEGGDASKSGLTLHILVGCGADFRLCGRHWLALRLARLRVP